MADIKNNRKKIIMSYANFTIAVDRYEAERKYDYSCESGFNKSKINIASGADACRLKIAGSLYSDTNPVYAFDTALKNSAASGLALDGMVFDNVALSRYAVKGASDDLAFDIELEFVSVTAAGGPMNV